MKISRRIILRITLITLSVLVMGVVGVSIVVLRSSAFPRFAFEQAENQIEGLAFENVKGSLTSGLSFSTLFENDTSQVEVKIQRFKISPSCLFKLTVCIDILNIDAIDVYLLDQSEPSEPTLVDLPEINLPVDIIVDQLSIEQINIVRSELLYTLNDFYTEVSWTGDQLSVGVLRAADQWCAYDASGEMNFRGDYPLSLSARCESKQYGSVNLQLNQELKDLQVDMTASLKMEFSEKNIPLQADVNLHLFELIPELEGSVRLAQQSSVKFSEDMVDVHSLVVNFSGSFDSLELRVDSTLEQQQLEGPIQVDVAAKLNSSNVALESLNIESALASLTAMGKLQFIQPTNQQSAAVIEWDADINIDAKDLSQIRNDLNGTISAGLNVNGSFANDELIVRSAIESFSGSVLDRELHGAGQVAYQGGVLAVNQLSLSHGRSSLEVHGDLSLDENSNINSSMAGSLSVPRMNQLVASSEGSVETTFTIEGQWPDITIASQGKVDAFKFDDLQINKGEYSLALKNQNVPDIDIDLTANQIRYAGTAVNLVSIQSSGDSLSQKVLIDIQDVQLPVEFSERDSSEQSLTVECDISQSSALIEGACARIDINVGLGETLLNWRLQDQLAFIVSEQKIEVGDFCLKENQSTVCSSTPILFEDGELQKIQIDGNKLAVNWLQPWLPQAVEAQGEWQFSAAGEKILADPNFEITVNSSTAAFDWQREDQETFVINIETLELLALGNGSKSEFQWQLKTEKIGSWSGEAALENNIVDGEIVMEQLRLLPLSPLLFETSAETVDGIVNAQFNLSGNIKNPDIDGQLKLVDGAVNISALPVPVSDITFNANIVNSKTDFSGTFAAKESEGELAGDFVWEASGWGLNLSLKSDTIAYRVDEDFMVSVIPDIELTMAPDRIDIAGNISIPKARISIKELPPQAVKPSADTVIVDRKAKDSQASEVNVQLQVDVGDDVRFSGYGLETQLAGSLQINQNSQGILRANGTLRLNEGRYEIYGQSLLIKVGDIIFVGDVQNPQLRLEAVREKTTDEVTVGLRATGPAQNPTIKLYSSPEMIDQLKLRYLLTGSGSSQSTEEINPEAAAAEAALGYILESKIGTDLTRRAGSVLGVEELKVTTSSGDTGTQVGLSGYLTPKLMVRYGLGVFDSINSLTLQYELSKNLYLEAVSSDSDAVDLLWIFNID